MENDHCDQNECLTTVNSLENESRCNDRETLIESNIDGNQLDSTPPADIQVEEKSNGNEKTLFPSKPEVDGDANAELSIEKNENPNIQEHKSVASSENVDRPKQKTTQVDERKLRETLETVSYFFLFQTFFEAFYIL